jgi:two-component system, OmpR family, KDP operon response regulator KdpE
MICVMKKSDIPAILVVENDRQNRRLLQVRLEECGFRIFLTTTGGEGIAHCRLNPPDLVIFDIDDVEGDAYGVVRQLHADGNCPVIVLSSRAQENDVVGFLEHGADDYIVKPFRSGELIARIRVALRRRNTAEEKSPLTLGSLTVDYRTRRVWNGEEQVRLTPTEYALLLLLIRNVGKVLTHRYILEQIWGEDHIGETEYLRVYVGHLRTKLRDDPARPEFIVTASGIGYGLRLDPGSQKPQEGHPLPGGGNLTRTPGTVTP